MLVLRGGDHGADQFSGIFTAGLLSEDQVLSYLLNIGQVAELNHFVDLDLAGLC